MRLIIFILIFNIISFAHAQRRSSVTLGAYYFDGWTGNSDNTITDSLRIRYTEREPTWGWITSTQRIMNEQINLASSNGIDFFTFCWYLPQKKNPVEYPLNNAVGLFMISPNKARMKFSILVANHEPYLITPNNWSIATTNWIKLFKDTNYLRANGKPLLTFFSFRSLLKEFGSIQILADSLKSFREDVTKAGFSGLSLAINISVPSDKVSLENAKIAGFDIFTGYNYHDEGFDRTSTVTPISNMVKAENKVWELTKNHANFFIPVTTLNWDPRPWRTGKVNEIKRYSGFSGKSVIASISSLLTWMDLNHDYLTPERIALVFAWNEYGEGGWLTPSKAKGNELLEGIKKARGIK